MTRMGKAAVGNRTPQVTLWRAVRGIGLSLAILFGSLTSATAFAGQELIEELEDLRRSLPSRDSSTRRSLTLKLANAYFGEILELGVAGIESSDTRRTIQRYRGKALELYKQLLSGDKGRYEKAHGEERAVIRFHMARLFADQGTTAKALPLWESLVRQGEYPKLVGESALSLAEIAEGKNAASKRALRFYRVAKDNLQNPDTISYLHYRMAWVLRNQQRYAEAIKNLKVALTDDRGAVKSEVVDDLIVFYSLSSLDSSIAVSDLEVIAPKLAVGAGGTRPAKERLHGLKSKLADAYLAAGKKSAALAVLESLDRRQLGMVQQVRLAEESYGLRKWETFSEALDQVVGSPLAAQSEKDQAIIKKILKRLTVQLDAERLTNKENIDYFLAAVDAFLHFFPKDKAAFKMASGTVQVDNDTESQVERLRHYIGDERFAFTKDQRMTMREHLVGLLQKSKDHQSAALEAQILAMESPSPKERRRFRFVQASELFDAGRKSEAVPIYIELARENPADTIGKKSQLLAVRFFGRQENFEQAVQVSDSWLAAVAQDVSLKRSSEYKAIAEIREKSEFEWAAGQPAGPKPLAIFKNHCFRDSFAPKSCENAKSMAVTLRDYNSLIDLLKRDGDTDELLRVYEAGGYFREAAELYDKKWVGSNKGNFEQFLHVAILYEIAAVPGQRDRVLKRLVAKVRKNRKPGWEKPEHEGLLYESLAAADLLRHDHLSLPWSKERSCRLAERVAAEKVTNPVREALLACEFSPGPHWGNVILGDLQKRDRRQRSQKFYGRGSQRAFQKRIKAVKALAEYADRFLPAADREAYLTIVQLVQTAYGDLAAEVRATPIPKEVQGQQRVDVAEALKEMAAPFQEKAQQYAAMLRNESLSAHPNGDPKRRSVPLNGGVLNMQQRKTLQLSINRLKTDPKDIGALRDIRSLYDDGGNKRIAAYFDGRIQQLENQKASF